MHGIPRLCLFQVCQIFFRELILSFCPCDRNSLELVGGAFIAHTLPKDAVLVDFTRDDRTAAVASPQHVQNNLLARLRSFLASAL